MAPTQFTSKELSYMHDQDFLSTKNLIMSKTFDLLGEIEDGLHRQNRRAGVPPWFAKKSSKISRGEQYQGLPYMILDYPRIFEHQDVLAFRVMFWWGNFFSATLHLGGKFLEQYRAILLQNQSFLHQSSYYFCISDDPWQYHYNADYYQPLQSFDQGHLQEVLSTRKFVKISMKWPLDMYTELPGLVIDTWENLRTILGQKE